MSYFSRFINLLGNQGGACASSSKQQAASSKQAAPQGPFWAPEQQGSQNREKKCYHAGMVFCSFLGNNFFFRFRPLVPPIGAVRTEKTWPFSGPKMGHRP